MPPRHLRVHIGAPKTGSTALQRMLTARQAELASLGIRYPNVSLRGGGHHDVAFLLGGGYPEWATPQPLGIDTLGEQLAADLRDRDHTLLLSSEDFYLFPKPQALLDWVCRWAGAPETVTIDVVVRDQPSQAVSWYNQIVKAQGFAGTFAASLQRDGDLWDYEAQLAPWAQTFGDDALRLFRYPTQGGDICKIYASELGLSAGWRSPAPTEQVNRRLLRDVLEFQRLLNGLPLPTVKKRRLHRSLMALSAQDPRPAALRDAPIADPTMLQSIAQRYQQSNNTPEARWGRGQVLFAPADGPAPAKPVQAPPHEPLSGDAVATIVGWLLLRDED